MNDMKVIEGYIQNLKIEDSIIHPLKNLDKQAVGTAFIGALASSSTLMSNAPLMMMAARGEAAKTFTGHINGTKVIGQFTTVKFSEGTPLIMVISKEKEQGHHLAYAVLDPKAGLLYMVFEMGASVSMGFRNNIKISLMFSCLFAIGFLFLFFYFWFDIDFTFGSDFYSLLEYLGYGIVLGIVMAFTTVFLATGKSAYIAGKWSEQIFKKLGFEQEKKQSFIDDYLNDDGISQYVMKYRKSLIGKDPYPENYFEKNEKN